MAAVSRTMLCVITVMTSLTEGTEIAGVVMSRIMVEVGNSQNHIDGIRRTRAAERRAPGVVLDSAELTPVLRPLQYFLPYLLPVLRVEMS